MSDETSFICRGQFAGDSGDSSQKIRDFNGKAYLLVDWLVWNSIVVVS
jgi:hypothetical protein